MKSPIFSKEKLLYFPQKSGIVPIFRKSPSSYISYFCEHTPCYSIVFCCLYTTHGTYMRTLPPWADVLVLVASRFCSVSSSFSRNSTFYLFNYLKQSQSFIIIRHSLAGAGEKVHLLQTTTNCQHNYLTNITTGWQNVTIIKCFSQFYY